LALWKLDTTQLPASDQPRAARLAPHHPNHPDLLTAHLAQTHFCEFGLRCTLNVLALCMNVAATWGSTFAE